ncbi:hypothetical protein P7K49_010359 [Saguinus oedipus]|uniref:Uncharacterized protein n=1 Tax=Saguinus oedipus TaxID=9490 RepID=A0ABQ9VMK7_SAGOE|nr:hypothetical protein P7K49_010359 [Saguinus oedipus]
MSKCDDVTREDLAVTRASRWSLGLAVAAVSAMRRTFRGRSPEDQWPSGSLTSRRRDSSDTGSERAADTFALPQYRVDPRDLDELHRAAWRGDVPGLERVLLPGGPDVDERDNENR